LPQTQRRHDAIWVVVDRLTKSTHFLPICKDYSVSRLAEIFQQEIVRLHGTPSAIISDRDPRFASRFWKGWLSYACHVNFHTMAGITCFETCTMCGCYTTYQLKSKKVLEVLNGSREALITEHGFWCSGIHDVPIKDALYPTIGYYRL
nr:transposon Ty3-I Gag-Pol polyprotein [Tanacetum cinerariifolium]